MTSYQIITKAFEVLNWLIIIRVLLSWIRHDPSHPVIKFIYEVTEPILAPFRKMIPSRPGMPIDFSPFLAILAIQFVQSIILGLIF